jgi:hypothetical protein
VQSYRVADETFLITWGLDAPPVGHFPMHSLVIRGEEPVLVDTGAPACREQWLATVEVIGPSLPTAPVGDVTAVLAHLLGVLERNANPAEAARQNEAAHQRATATGELWIDALTALQVAERAPLKPRGATDNPALSFWTDPPGGSTPKAGKVHNWSWTQCNSAACCSPAGPPVTGYSSTKCPSDPHRHSERRATITGSGIRGTTRRRR